MGNHIWTGTCPDWGGGLFLPRQTGLVWKVTGGYPDCKGELPILFSHHNDDIGQCHRFIPYLFYSENIWGVDVFLMGFQSFPMDKQKQYMIKYSFKRRCKDHQSRFRSKVLQVGFDEYENVLFDDDGFKNGLNFYSGLGIFSSVNKRYPYFRKPLYCNLLRSEHIPFNFFVPLVGDKEFGKMVFNEILGGFIQKITQIKIEYPEQTPTKYLEDRTSFDTYIEYQHTDGSTGILGIEVKYTEKSYPYSGPTEKEKMDDTDSIYYRRSKKSDVFENVDLTDLKQHKYRQIWRNHLLGESILIVDTPKFNHFHSLTFYPNGNTHFTEVLSGYKKFLKSEFQDRVQGVTYEKYFEICRKHLPNEEFEKWLWYLERRYIVK